jgi:outer membrane protein OmpA-like peptidoglycan-associated protein
MITAGPEKAEMEFKVIFPTLTGTVTGRVYDAQSHASQPAVIYFCGEDSGNIFVDSSGVFALIGFPVGNYRFNCASPNRDCISYQKEIVLYSTDTLHLEFPLVAAGRVRFPEGEKDIDPVYFGTLDSIGRYLTRNPKLALQIDGYTDSTNIVHKFPSNLALSIARAEEVKNYLINKFKLRDDRFIIQGFGETKPVASNDTEAGKTENRRVEFTFIARWEEQGAKD